MWGLLVSPNGPSRLRDPQLGPAQRIFEFETGTDPWITSSEVVVARWRELGEQSGGLWNPTYTVPAGANICNPADGSGPGLRRSDFGFELQFRPADQSVYPLTALLSPARAVLDDADFEAMLAALGEPALHDPRVRGVAATAARPDLLRPAASALLEVWPIWAALFDRALTAASPDLDWVPELAAHGAGRPGRAEHRRNVRQGRLGADGQPRRAQAWTRLAQEFSPEWWPQLEAAAARLEAVRDSLVAALGSRGSRPDPDALSALAALTLPAVALRPRGAVLAPGPRASSLDWSRALASLPPLLRPERAAPMRQLPVAGSAVQAVGRSRSAGALSALARTTWPQVVRAALNEATRVRHQGALSVGAAQRPEWELYQAYVTHATLQVLSGLGFETSEAWASLLEPGRRGDLIERGSSVSLRHREGHMQIRLRCESEWRVDGPAGPQVLRPDLVLELEAPGGGPYLDGPQAPPLMPLVLDAKCRNLYGLTAVEGVMEEVRKYQRLAPAGRPAMVFAVAPRGHSGRGALPSARAWPAAGDRLPPGADPAAGWARQLAPGLKPLDVPFRAGVLELHPPRRLADQDLAYGDLRRAVLAWLMRQGVIWLCQGCGCDLSARSHAELRRAASSIDGTTVLKNFDVRAPAERIGRIDGQETTGAQRLLARAGQALVCPDCDALWVYSRCTDKDCPGDEVMGRSYPSGLIRYEPLRPIERPGWVKFAPHPRPWLQWQINHPTGWLRHPRAPHNERAGSEDLWTDGVGGTQPGPQVMHMYCACAACGSVLEARSDPWEISNPTPRKRAEARRRVGPWRDIARRPRKV